MTEQPVETEQQFLGNETVAPVVLADYAQTQGIASATAPRRQHYAPYAHLRRPAWSPVDNVELGALARKSCQAAKLLATAKAESAKAEEALQLALGVEHEAETKLFEAEAAVRDFLRKDTGL